MLKTISVKNFKCFSDLSLPLQSLTLMTGYNGAGKSTVLQSFLLLAQAVKSDDYRNIINLNGNTVQLGTPSEVLRINSDENTINIELHTDNSTLSWELCPDVKQHEMRHKNYLKVNSIKNNGVIWEGKEKETQMKSEFSSQKCNIFEILKESIFISAIRRVDQEFFMSPSSNLVVGDVGVHGEFAPWFFHDCNDDEVSKEKRHPDFTQEVTLRRQYIAWASSIFPKSDADANKVGKWSNLIELGLRIGDGEYRRPANIGYGISYVFPIIIAGLLAKRGQVLIVDSPEAHLHPRAQSHMGRFLAYMAQAGVQIIIETHSDHLLNGVRLAVKDQIIPHDQVLIHFFNNDIYGDNENSCQVTTPNIDKYGGVDYWPEGFFDQSEKDVYRLMDWK